MYYRIPRLFSYFASQVTFYGRDPSNIYLTFDDGPNSKSTSQLLDLLSQLDVKATFFCVGHNVEKNAELLWRMRDEGHQIGNHTYDHEHGWLTSTEKYIKSVVDCDKVIQSDLERTLFRPPYGKLSLRQFLSLRNSHDCILWSLMTRDFDQGQSKEKCLEISKKKTRGGDIVVFHDTQRSYAKLEYVLPKYIHWCRTKGYAFGLI